MMAKSREWRVRAVSGDLSQIMDGESFVEGEWIVLREVTGDEAEKAVKRIQDRHAALEAQSIPTEPQGSKGADHG